MPNPFTWFIDRIAGDDVSTSKYKDDQFKEREMKAFENLINNIKNERQGTLDLKVPPSKKYVTFDYERDYWHIYTLDLEPLGMFDSPSVFTMNAPNSVAMKEAIKKIATAINDAVECAQRRPPRPLPSEPFIKG